MCSLQWNELSSLGKSSRPVSASCQFPITFCVTCLLFSTNIITSRTLRGRRVLFYTQLKSNFRQQKSAILFLINWIGSWNVKGFSATCSHYLNRGSHRLLLQKAAESRKEIADFCCRKLLLSECKIKTKRRVDSSLSRNRQKSRQNRIDFNKQDSASPERGYFQQTRWSEQKISIKKYPKL